MSCHNKVITKYTLIVCGNRELGIGVIGLVSKSLNTVKMSCKGLFMNANNGIGQGPGESGIVVNNGMGQCPGESGIVRLKAMSVCFDGPGHKIRIF